MKKKKLTIYKNKEKQLHMRKLYIFESKKKRIAYLFLMLNNHCHDMTKSKINL